MNSFRLTTIFVFLFIGLGLVSAFGFQQSHDAILLERGNVLTLSEGKLTNARRVSAIPQLQCVGGSASNRREFHPQTVQCFAQGSDGYDMQWKCEADLDTSVRFGKTQVSCEGYQSSSDEYILRGSCGLEYTLEYTNAGKQNQGSYGGGYSSPYSQSSPYPETSGSPVGKYIMFAILAFVLFSIARQCGQNSARQQAGINGAPSSGGFPGGFPGGYPGGQPGDNNGDGYYGGGNGYQGYPKTSSYGTGYTQPNMGYGHAQPNTGFQPGFWSGVGGGGLLGYFLGRNRNNGYGAPAMRPHYGSSYGSGFGGHSSSSGGSSSRVSSGFGGTNRR